MLNNEVSTLLHMLLQFVLPLPHNFHDIVQEEMIYYAQCLYCLGSTSTS